MNGRSDHGSRSSSGRSRSSADKPPSDGPPCRHWPSLTGTMCTRARGPPAKASGPRTLAGTAPHGLRAFDVGVVSSIPLRRRASAPISRRASRDSSLTSSRRISLQRRTIWSIECSNSPAEQSARPAYRAKTKSHRTLELSIPRRRALRRTRAYTRWPYSRQSGRPEPRQPLVAFRQRRDVSIRDGSRTSADTGSRPPRSRICSGQHLCVGFSPAATSARAFARPPRARRVHLVPCA
jgi:hypothetical protein